MTNRLRFYCQKVLPAVFDDSLSYYEVVCKLTEKVNEVIAALESTNANLDELAEKVQDLIDYIEGEDFDKYVRELVYEHAIEAIDNAMKMYIKQVFFGLTSDGRFCAYVPHTWDAITFDTGMIYGTPEYGRLILRYAPDGQGAIDNRYDYKMLYEALESMISLEAGDGLTIVDGKLSVDTGNGIAINPNTKMLEVPIGSNLRYTSDGIDVPDADAITKGVVKLQHEVENSNDPNMAVSPQGVYAALHV